MDKNKAFCYLAHMKKRQERTRRMKAYSYIRFSTTRQADGDSLRRQLELSERYAAKHKVLPGKKWVF